MIIFTIEYAMRLAAIGLNDQYTGAGGLLRFVLTPFSMVDLMAILPWYVDLVYNPGQNDIPALQFIRLFRLLRIMVRDPTTWTLTRHDGPWSSRTVVKCDT